MTRAHCTHLAISGDLKRINVSEYYGGKFPKDLPFLSPSSEHVPLQGCLRELPPDTADFYARGYIERLACALLLRPISGTEICNNTDEVNSTTG
jgi:hypothetical protein